MSKEFASYSEFCAYFSSEVICQNFLSELRFPNGIYCLICGHARVRTKIAGRFRCAKCRQDFSLRTNTVFADSKATLQQWLGAIFLLCAEEEGVTLNDLATTLRVSRKTASRIVEKLEQALSDEGQNMLTETPMIGVRHRSMVRKRQIASGRQEVVSQSRTAKQTKKRTGTL